VAAVFDMNNSVPGMVGNLLTSCDAASSYEVVCHGVCLFVGWMVTY
jgi:hypothetical protein